MAGMLSCATATAAACNILRRDNNPLETDRRGSAIGSRTIETYVPSDNLRSDLIDAERYRRWLILEHFPIPLNVMAGLVPAIHVLRT
jgi:hypothetical protein